MTISNAEKLKGMILHLKKLTEGAYLNVTKALEAVESM